MIECPERRGFLVEYTSLEVFTSCGGNVSSESGILSSPSYPDPYPHMANCIFLISQTNGTYVNLSVVNMDIDCDGMPSDYIEMRDGNSQDSPLVGRFCGNGTRIPPFMISTQNFFWIR